jgi:hypothetical protein
MELIQRSLFSKNIYSIESAVLRITQKDVFESKEFTIPLDEISPNYERRYFRQNIVIPLVIAFLFFCLGVYCNLIDMSFTTLLIILYVLWQIYSKSRSVIKLNTKPKLLTIDAQFPSKTVVDSFITTLFQKQKEYLKWKFGT